MNFKSLEICLFIFMCSLLCHFHGQAQSVYLKQVSSFFPKSDRLNKEDISWNYLTVPEDWEDSTSKHIHIAVAILKKKSEQENTSPILFLQGGPGASGIRSVEFWLDSPLRKKNDIVLIDIRGTGFSEPTLCPDLGQKFLEILAKDQSSVKDDQEKVSAALACRDDLVSRGINISAYNSFSVARDLHALKTLLGYSNWNLYGVSYGTYMARVYNKFYSRDIKTITLDSPVADITKYYTYNTTNYLNSLKKVFTACDKDPDCKARYPNLENVYYEVIANLKKSPITVSVDENLVKNKKFTFGQEDFKVAIQQALYNKQLIEIVPLMIYQFSNRKHEALGNLVSSFVGLLRMDYGAYYCISCNEVLPNNSLSGFLADASHYNKLEGGLSFYKSDFLVCQHWNNHRYKNSVFHFDLADEAKSTTPVMIFSGEYDPLMPVSNSTELVNTFKNGQSITAFTYGHAPGLTNTGQKLYSSFVSNAGCYSVPNDFKKYKLSFFDKGVINNKGVLRFGKSLDQFNIILFAPLLIALLIVLSYAFIYAVNIYQGAYITQTDRLAQSCTVITSLVGITAFVSLVYAVGNTVMNNYFVLAFGLPDNYEYVIYLLWIFILLLFITFLYIAVIIKNLNQRSAVLSILVVNVIIASYFLYWNLF